MVHAMSYDQLQQQLAKGGYTFVDFWAEWCGPCKRLAPTFEEVSKEYHGKCTFVKVNVEENPDAANYGISSIPCLILFKDGQEVERLVGALPEEMLRERLKEMIK